MKITLDNILKNLNKNLSEMEKARYLYIELGKVLTSNLDFVFRDDYYQYEKFLSGILLEKSNFQNKISCTCSQASSLYAELLRKAGIQARTVGYNVEELSHVDTIAVIDGKEYLFDIILDTMNIQKGFRTSEFCKRNFRYSDDSKKIYDTIDDEELYEIDKKLGYCKNGMYMNDVIKMLKDEMLDEDKFKKFMEKYRGKDGKETKILKYKLDFIFNCIRNSKSEENKMDIMETYKYYTVLLSELLTEEEAYDERHFRKSNFHVTYFDKNKKFPYSILYEHINDGESMYYVYKNEEGKFVPTTKDEILEDINNGMKVYSIGKSFRIRSNTVEKGENEDDKGRG